MQQLVRRLITLATTATLVFVGVAVIMGPTEVSAASTDADPGQVKIFEKKICPALKKLNDTKLYKYCKSYSKQAALDTASKKICDKYGYVGNKKLSGECDDYNNYVKGSDCGVDTCPDSAANSKCTNDQCDLISLYLNPAITALSALVGLSVVISIIIGGIQYSSSEGDPQKASRAKTRITNAIFAFVVYLFLFAFLQFIIPGGLFR